MRRPRFAPLLLASLLGPACGAEEPPLDEARLVPPYADAKYGPVDGQLVGEPEPDVRLYEVGSSVPGIAGRRVVVVLPPGYAEPAEASRRYPVVYMGDGDNVLSTSAFGRGGWEIPRTSRMLTGTATEPVIFVCPYNAGAKRRAEYTLRHAEAGEDGATPERYLDWLQYNLMPFVDGELRTSLDPDTRGIGGSSSAAILALYAAWTRPSVYRRVLALSTFHWDMETFIPRVEGAAEKPPIRKIYLDSGSPSDGVTEMTRIAEALVGKGFVEGADLKTYVGENHMHDERFWRIRFPIGLEFAYPLGLP